MERLNNDSELRRWSIHLKGILVFVALFAIPSVAFAHSGTIARAVMNYMPLLIPLLPSIILKLRKVFQFCLALFQKKTDDNTR